MNISTVIKNFSYTEWVLMKENCNTGKAALVGKASSVQALKTLVEKDRPARSRWYRTNEGSYFLNAAIEGEFFMTIEPRVVCSYRAENV